MRLVKEIYNIDLEDPIGKKNEEYIKVIKTINTKIFLI